MFIWPQPLQRRISGGKEADYMLQYTDGTGASKTSLQYPGDKATAHMANKTRDRVSKVMLGQAGVG